MNKIYLFDKIYQRLVSEEDASFIFELRTDKQLAKHLSVTNGTVQDQVDWIKNYKVREAIGLEYYFITENEDGEKFGLNRIYNMKDNTFELGSWLFKKDAPSGISILSDIATREYGFNILNLTKMVFEVRRENKSVIKYHHLFLPSLVREDELNYYYSLSKDKFNSQKIKILKIYGKE
jgi:RimJ/RimL family protein N-acetyltransferase